MYAVSRPHDVRLGGEQPGHHGGEVGSRRIKEERIVQGLDTGRLERGKVGCNRGNAQCVVLRANHVVLQLRTVACKPVDAGDVVDGMHFGRSEERRRFRREVRRQQRGEEHAGVVGHRLHSGPGVATEHHDELDAVLADELGRPGPRLGGVVLVVVGDELELVVLAADGHATGRVHPLAPDPAAVQPGLAPGRDVTGERGEKTDLDHIVRGEGTPRKQARRRESTGNRGRRAEQAPTAQSLC